MPVCDICNKEISWEDGYVLTTNQVTTTEAYWEATLKGAWSSAHKMSPNGETLLMLARQQAAQTSGWLICEACSGGFSFDRTTAKNYAKNQDASPPGAGSAPEEAVARCAARVWMRLYGQWPSSIPAMVGRPGDAARDLAMTFLMSQPSKQPKSGCFIATTVYGGYDVSEVVLLREWRDDYLIKYAITRHFVQIYYKVGPHLAAHIDRHPLLRCLTRIVLTSLTRVLPHRR